MNKEIIAKQKKLLGLIFGMGALVLVNLVMHRSIIFFFDGLIPLWLMSTQDLQTPSLTLGIFSFTIFQMWAIYKYILKK